MDDLHLQSRIAPLHEHTNSETALRFLSEASVVLSSSLEYAKTLENLARLVLDYLADGCAVDVATGDGGLERLVLVSRDPAKAERVAELERRYPTPLDSPAGNVTAFRTGEPQIYPTLPDELLAAASRDETHYALWKEIGMESVMCVPLLARGRTLGVITLVSHTPGWHFDAADLQVAQELARRAAVAMDNALLYSAERQARRVSERLQALAVALSEAATPGSVGEALMRHGVDALEAWGGVLALATGDGAELEIVSSVGYPPDACMGPGRRWPAAAEIPLAEAVRSGEAVLVGSGEEWTRRYGRPGGGTGRSGAWAAVPLQLAGETCGALLWSFDRPRRFAEADRALMGAITRMGAQALERARLYEEAAEANLAKSRFLATMSHELRTPLTAIIGYGELLADGITGPVTEAQRAQLGRIKASAGHLLGLIDEVLSFARLEAGKETVHLEPVEVAEVVASAAELVAPLAAARGIALAVDEPVPTATLATDHGKLRQVLLNLLSNAVKFTEVGEVRLSAALREGGVSFQVRDTGVGIPPEQLQRIFEPFVQVESSTTRRFGGTGLGLSVSRQLARLLGGEIRAESMAGVGSTFTVWVPTHAPSAPA